MDVPERIYVRQKSSKEGANYTRDDLCADPALLAEAVEVIRRLESSYTSHLFNSMGDFYEPGREPEVIAARAFLAKLENRQ